MDNLIIVCSFENAYVTLSFPILHMSTQIACLSKGNPKKIYSQNFRIKLLRWRTIIRYHEIQFVQRTLLTG